MRPELRDEGMIILAKVFLGFVLPGNFSIHCACIVLDIYIYDMHHSHAL